MSKYDEDFADKAINNTKLKALFNTGTSAESEKPAKKSKNLLLPIGPDDIVTFDSVPPDDRKDPDTIIYDNIQRAERFLDIIETNINRGETSARLFEVASGLINSITQAAASVVGSNQYSDEMLYKDRLLQLKEREVAVKEALGKGGPGKVTNNILVTSRADLLKVMNEKQEQEEVVNI